VHGYHHSLQVAPSGENVEGMPKARQVRGVQSFIRSFKSRSGFWIVGRRDVGKALVWSHEVTFRREDAEIGSDGRVL
jgi:hypothetical protein